MDIAQVKLDDWSGGMTDHYVNGPLNCSQRLNNFLINRNRKPVERPGSDIWDEENEQIPAGNSRISKIQYYGSLLYQQSARNVYFIQAGSFETLVGPVSSNPVYGAGTVASHVAMTTWRDHILTTIDTWSSPRKIYIDQSNAVQVRNLGLPDLASSPSVVLDSTGGTSMSYLYAFCHAYTYQVGTVTHTNRGPITFVTATDAAGTPPAPGNPSVISAIPVMSNGATECWDTANIKVEVYRTTNGGADLKYVGQVTNGTTTFNDTVPDASLGVAIYTAGNVVENDPPPQAKYIINVDGVVWYLNVKEGSEEKPFRARQAIKDQPDAAPGDYFIDVEGSITGGGAVDVYPIIFTKTKAYRFEGFVDNQGIGFTRKRVISSTVGCVSHNSIVPVVGGLYFAGLDGFYFTDGTRVQKISNHLNASYRDAVETDVMQKRIHGALDSIDGRVYWTMTTDATETDCDHIWVLDPYYGINAESTFTTWSADTDMRPTSLLFLDDGTLVRADNRGYVFYHSNDFYTDPVVDTDNNYEDWVTKSVEYDYISTANSFGTEIQKKFIPKITVVAKNETNLSLLIQSINDDSGLPKDLKEIRFRSNVAWGDPDIAWGDPSIQWNYQGVILAERWFPKGSLRCIYKQVRMTNSDTVINNSDDYGTVTVDQGNSTVILDDATKEWVDNLGGYYIYFANDNYTQGFYILDVTDDTLTLDDPTTQMPSDGVYEWIIKGKRKSERFSLESFSLNYEMFGEATKGFQSGEGGENA